MASPRGPPRKGEKEEASPCEEAPRGQAWGLHICEGICRRLLRTPKYAAIRAVDREASGDLRPHFGTSLKPIMATAYLRGNLSTSSPYTINMQRFAPSVERHLYRPRGLSRPLFVVVPLRSLDPMSRVILSTHFLTMALVICFYILNLSSLSSVSSLSLSSLSPLSCEASIP